MSSLASILQDGPVGYWPLDETAGTNADDKGSSNLDGTYSSGFALNVAGPNHHVAADFTGTGYVQLTDDAIYSPAGSTGRLTFEGFCRADTLVNNGWLFTKATSGAYEWSLGMKNTGALDVAIMESSGATISGAVTQVGTIVAGRWFHYAVTYDKPMAVSQLFVNGVRIQSFSCTGNNVSDGIAGPRIAHRGSDGSPMDGQQCHCAIYNKVLAPRRIFAHAVEGLEHGALPGRPNTRLRSRGRR